MARERERFRRLNAEDLAFQHGVRTDDFHDEAANTVIATRKPIDGLVAERDEGLCGFEPRM